MKTFQNESYNKIETTYQPNATVRAAMQANKYVVEQAKERLSAEARTAMEASLEAFENTYTEEEYQSIILQVHYLHSKI